MSNEVVSTTDQRVASFLAAGVNSAVVDPEKAQLDIVRRILASDSIEDVLKQQEAIHAKDVLDECINITGIRYMESDIKDSGPAFYMLVDCVTPNGEPFAVTCGAVNVMAQLHRLNDLDAFPLLATIVEVGKPTKAGYKPMWLEVAHKPAAEAYDPFAKTDF